MPLAGVRLRPFRGNSDYPSMAQVLTASERADGIERRVSAEDLAAAYQHLTNCDPYQDMIFAEVAGEIAGYSRTWWWDETSSGRLYGLAGFVAPGYRRQGIGRALLGWSEARAREMAASHSVDQAKFYQVDVSQLQKAKALLLEHAGYKPVRFFVEMVRPNLEGIPDWPLPEGLELRSVSPDDYRAIWNSVDETSRDEWGYTQPTEDGYQAWLSHAHFQPDLWQIAWEIASGQVVGHVLTFIDQDENKQMDRKRGYTEGVGVARTWRRRGLARALIARSLQVQRASGMTESALAADSVSPRGVTRLYARCGFQVMRRDTIYRKPLVAAPGESEDRRIE